MTREPRCCCGFAPGLAGFLLATIPRVFSSPRFHTVSSSAGEERRVLSSETTRPVQKRLVARLQVSRSKSDPCYRTVTSLVAVSVHRFAGKEQGLALSLLCSGANRRRRTRGTPARTGRGHRRCAVRAGRRCVQCALPSSVLARLARRAGESSGEVTQPSR